jgi:DNA polymerase phi
MTGQEERDVLFARLFGLTSVIQSGLLVRQKPLPTSASTFTLASSLAGYKETLSQLLLLGVKKSWLRESAWWTTSLALDALNDSNVSWKEEAVDATVKSIFVDIKIWTPEKIAVALKLQAWCPERDWQEHLSPTFKNPEILSTGNLNMLARILKVG